MPSVKLTKTVIEKTPPPERETFLWDTQQSKLGLRLMPSGKRSYVVRFRMGGRETPSRRMTLGSCADMTLDQARDAAREAIDLVRRGIDPRTHRQEQRAERITFGTVYASYLETEARPKLKAWHKVDEYIRRDVHPQWQDRPISELTRSDVVALRDAVHQRSPSTAQRMFECLRPIFTFAVERAFIEASPATGIRPLKKPSSRDRVLTDDEIEAILPVARTMGAPYGSLVLFLFLTAQRRGEVAGARWSEIDLDKAIWTIPKERSKNGLAHQVPLSPPALDLLRALPRMGDLVFPSANGGELKGWSKYKKRLDALSKTSGWTLHDIRRTVVTKMASLGVQPHVTDKILNHNSVVRGVAAVYNRAQYMDERRDALLAWGQDIAGLAKRCESATPPDQSQSSEQCSYPLSGPQHSPA